MSNSQKYIKNLISSANVSMQKVAQNTPKQYNSIQRQYLAERTSSFVSKRSYLASDLVNADVQGLGSYFYDYTNLNIRLSDIVNVNTSLNKRTDDYKEILIPDNSINYVPIGAKIKAMGSYWIVTNPSNIVSVNSSAVVTRCNATYNSYDFYGNIVTEPIIVEKVSMLGNDNETPINMVLMDGYYNITCQLNENTVKLGQNKRIMLGSKPYYITGFSDFIQEFSEQQYKTPANEKLPTFDVNVESGELSVSYPENYDGATYKIIGNNLYKKGKDDGTNVYLQDGAVFAEMLNDYPTHLITFTARIDEPNKNDNMDNNIADGNNYVVSAVLNGNTELQTGQSTTLTPNFLINGKTAENPCNYEITWSYTVDNSEVAEITSNGVVTAIGEGTTTITAVLDQNPEVTATLELSVKESANTPYVAFNSVVETAIRQYEEQAYSASYYLNNLPTDTPLIWTFSGAKSRDYNAVVSEDGKSVTIECVSASDTPLTITASYDDYSESITVQLEGY